MSGLSTSVCMLSGPGALARLRNLTILMRASESIPARSSSMSECNHRSLQDDKNIHNYLL